MDRLLVLRLETSGIEAEALMNGVPLLRVGQQRRVALAAVHEYALVGANQLELSVRPPPPAGAPAALPAELSDGATWVRLQLLLPRTGSGVHTEVSRTLGQLEWAPAEGEVMAFPAQLDGTVELPIAFPRWRWLDAPVLAAAGAAPAGKVDAALEALKAPLAAWLQEITLGLARGDAAPLLQACRLRLEELAIAYQQPVEEVQQRWGQQIQSLHVAEPLKPMIHTSATLGLRAVAQGRLIEVLGPDGEPALRAPRRPQGAGPAWVAWPMRVTMIQGRFYGLR